MGLTTLSRETLSKVVQATNGEYAWQKQDLPRAINDLIKSGNAILGAEAWAVVPERDDVSVTIRFFDGRIAVGLIPGKDGTDGVYSWSCERNESEIWQEYVQRSGKEVLEAIEKMDVENDVASEFAHTIYYNLTWASDTPLTTMERAAIEAIIEVNPEYADIFNKQLQGLTVTDRYIDGAGFHTNFKIPDDAPRISERKTLRLDGISIDTEETKDAGAFLVLVENGAMVQLEGYTLQQLEWAPAEGDKFKLKRIVYEREDANGKYGGTAQEL